MRQPERLREIRGQSRNGRSKNAASTNNCTPEKPSDGTRADGAGQEHRYGTRLDQVEDYCGFVLGAASAKGRRDRFERMLP